MRTTPSRPFLAAGLGLSILTVPAAAAPTPRHAAHETDMLLGRLTARIDAVDTTLAAATRARRIPARDVRHLRQTLAWVRTDSARYAKQQGFLSAAESASYNRALDEVEAKLR